MTRHTLLSAFSFAVILFLACRHGEMTSPTTSKTAYTKDTTLLFFYSRGCEDCYQMYPRIQHFLSAHPAIRLQKEDVDSLGWTSDLLRQYGIEKVPTLLLLAPDGKRLPIED